VGQRSSTETLAGIYQSFLAHRTWKQKDLAKELSIGVEPLRRMLFELQEKGMPLDREEDHPHVYWSVPPNWFPGSVLFKREEIPELLRQLRRVPQGPGRKRLLDIILDRLPGVDPPGSSVVAPHASPEEEQYLAVVEDSASSNVALSFRYYTATRGDVSDRHASVHRVLVGPPSRFIATCHRSNTLKTFRVDGIMRARLDDQEPYRKAADVDIDAYMKGSLDGYHGGGAALPFAFLVRDPEARWVKNNLLDGMKPEPTADGIRITIQTTALARLARFVVALGGAAKAETPALAQAVAELANGALASAPVADAVQDPDNTGEFKRG
jgi:predicted DNA-binding transcriptional regulator YafY